MENEIIFHVVGEPFSLKARRLFGRTLTWFIPFRKVRHRVRDFISNYQIFKVINKYDCIFSAGERCFVAKNLLKKMGLRKFSGPLDWVYGGDPITRLNLIADEFANYFNKEDLVYKGDPDTDLTSIYLNERTKLVYIHDFKRNCDFDHDYPAVREKYDRRIARVVNKMKSGERTLIIYVDYDEKKSDANKDGGGGG